MYTGYKWWFANECEYESEYGYCSSYTGGEIALNYGGGWEFNDQAYDFAFKTYVLPQ
jgi:hypothetical protein